MRRYLSANHRRREGLSLLESALAGHRPDDDPALVAKVLVAVAYVAAGIDADKCARYAHAASEAALQLGDSRTATLAKAVLARGLGLAAQPDESKGEEALRMARQAGDPSPCEGLSAMAFSIWPYSPDAAPAESLRRSSSP